MSIEHTQISHTELIDVLKNIFAQEENAIRLVLQKNTGEKFLYPPLDNVLYMNVDKVLDILDFIVSTKFMVKKQVETLKFCPICFSYQIIPTEHCNNCGSTNISRGRIIEHFACGYKNLESMFLTKDGLECPRCHSALLVESEDHDRGKLMYKCHACGNLYDEPVIDYHCQKCGEYFPIGELGETIVYQYEVTDHKMELIKSSLRALESLESSLKENNYSVKRSTEVTGTSGITYDVDLYATNSVKGDNILAETYLLEDKLTVDEILRLQAIGYDLNANKIVIITHTSLDQKAESLANYYNLQRVLPERTGEITKEQVTKLL
jgi:transposase-like protein